MKALWPILVLAWFSGQSGAETIETAHYRLEAEGDNAKEQARVLEAAWPQFKAFFGAEPKTKERLRVRYFVTREAWVKALMADRAIPPGKAGGYYWPRTKTAYLYKQPTRSYTRTLLLHEAGHQFHYLARTKNSQPGAAWYTEGIAEYLAEHFWDGEELQLAVVQRVTLKDYPKSALQILKRDGLVLDDMTPRAVGWALVRYLATQDKRKFAKLRKRLDAGAKSKLRATKKLQAKLIAWLETQQEPWAQIFNEWNGVDEKSIRGFAGVVSMCRVKGATKRLEVSLVVPPDGRFKAGLLLEFKSAKHYTIALLDQRGTLNIQRRHDGRWTILERHQTPPLPAEKIPFLATRDAQGVHLTVAGHKFGPWKFEGDVLGLALEDCDVTFVGLDSR